MNNIELEGKQYELIEGTQGDGRCFSASVFYDLNGRVASNEELNQWIQKFIIVPILNTEEIDCPQFLLWAAKWAGIHNSSGHWSFIKDEAPESEELEKIEEVLSRLSSFEEMFVNILPPPSTDLQNPNTIPLVDEQNLLQTLSARLAELIENPKYKEIPNTPDFIDELTQLENIIIQTGVSLTNEIKTDNISRVKVMETNYPITLKIKVLKNKICNNYKKNPNYNILVELYKRYITLLNTPQVNSNGDVEYEWTEPNVGPVEILLNQPIIRSINIYSEINKRFEHYKHKGFLSKNSYDLYLHYSGNHYKPLIPIGGSSIPPEDSLEATGTKNSSPNVLPPKKLAKPVAPESKPVTPEAKPVAPESKLLHLNLNLLHLKPNLSHLKPNLSHLKPKV